MNGNWTDLAFILVPLAYLLAAAIGGTTRPATGWRVLQTGNALALALALALPLIAAPISGLFLDGAANFTVLTVVAFIGLIVARFSTHYMARDTGEARFQRWLQITLACVAVVVTTNHFAILVLAWAGISLSLHQLLMYYPERKRAALAAHKKFLFARLAEACLLIAGVLLYQQHGTLFITELLEPYRTGTTPLVMNEQIAALLIASAAMVKCAQFPMHGWLIQVVEAPTPVSALLHAGIVNLGGYLLIIMAPLMLQAEPASWLLLIVAGLTCIAAALITMTRISIKVLLAWSTVAQMGLMLVECALGQYGLALLHLAAHSCYKAFSFLNAGSQVESFLRQHVAMPKAPSSGSAPLLFAVLAAAIIAAEVALGDLGTGTSLWLLFALVPVILLTEHRSTLGASALAPALGLSLLLAAAYGIQKLVFSGIVASPGIGDPAQALWCAFLVVLLLGAYWMLRQHNHSGVARRLYRNLYAGFYLDEWATRVTLTIWPAQLPRHAGQRQNPAFSDMENAQ